MADVQSATAEAKKKRRNRKNKRQDENIMACPIPYGGHNKQICRTPYAEEGIYRVRFRGRKWNVNVMFLL